MALRRPADGGRRGNAAGGAVISYFIAMALVDGTPLDGLVLLRRDLRGRPTNIKLTGYLAFICKFM